MYNNEKRSISEGTMKTQYKYVKMKDKFENSVKKIPMVNNK